MTWNLFIDDERNLEDVTWVTWQVREKYRNEDWKISRNYHEVVALVEEFGFPSFVSFDHDLGDKILHGDGYEIAKYLCEIDMNSSFHMPEDFDFIVHSQNPIGKENIESYLNNFIEFKNKSHIQGYKT